MERWFKHLTIALKVVVYDRNTVTNKKLEEYGLRLIKIREVNWSVDLVVCQCHSNEEILNVQYLKKFHYRKRK